MKIKYFLIALTIQSTLAEVPEGISAWETRIRCDNACIKKGIRLSDTYTTVVILKHNSVICGVIEGDYGLKYGNKTPSGLLAGNSSSQDGSFEYSDSFAKSADDRGKVNFTSNKDSLKIFTIKSPSQGYLTLPSTLKKLNHQPHKLISYAKDICNKYDGNDEKFFNLNW